MRANKKLGKKSKKEIREEVCTVVSEFRFVMVDSVVD